MEHEHIFAKKLFQIKSVDNKQGGQTLQPFPNSWNVFDEHNFVELYAKINISEMDCKFSCLLQISMILVYPNFSLK